jgi:hypothetical protein
MIDTRNAGGVLVANSTRSFLGWGANFANQGGAVTNNCNIPPNTDTAAIVVNFTIVSPSTGGYITAYPGNATQPLAASLNFNAADVKGNNAIIKLNQTGAGSHLNIYTTSTTHLVADVVGYYAKPVALGALNRDLVYTPVTPCRIIDTRSAGADAGILNAGSTRSFLGWNGSYTVQGGDNTDCNLPFSTNNAAIVVNFTVVSPNAAGYITAFPADAAQPLAVTLNFGAGEVKGNNAFLKLNQTSGQVDFNVYSTAATHLVADVVGYYAKPVALPMVLLSSDLVYTPVTPCRIMDTRSAASGALAAAGTGEFLGWTSTNFSAQGGSNTACGLQADTNNAAIAVNFTIVSPSSGGYITAYPSNAAKPLAATLNFNAGDVKGSNAILKLNQTGSGSHFNIYSTSATHLVADVVGYYAKPK